MIRKKEVRKDCKSWKKMPFKLKKKDCFILEITPYELIIINDD